MNYQSVKEAAQLWAVSERTVRNYCASGKIAGAFLTGKTWNIPKTACKPGKEKLEKINNDLLNVLLEQKQSNLKGGIYHKTQVLLCYNSNHIEGSKLTEEQTRYIFETNTIGIESTPVNIDDIVEAINHFRCFDYILENATLPLTEKFIKQLHFILKSGTSDSKKEWFNVGEYKKIANEVGGLETTKPEQVKNEMQKLINAYNKKQNKTFEDIVLFHQQFESIHPFQDGNGRVGRLIIFKQCLENNIVPFIITEQLKFYYYRGLKEWNNEKGFLIDTLLTAQDQYKQYLQYFNIKY